MPAKVGAAAAGGAGALAVVYRFRNEAALLAILLIGVVFVIMLLLGYRYFIEWRDRKKGKAFGGGLGQGAGARPAQATASEQRVLLDDLRKKFQEGLKVFEATGKSVYRLPWYLVVGEPGSGKSRMIERSGVPGPSRLKDPVEGAGGTINMNWWFRNEAVMLDTAGRLMMPEVATAESPEWDNFLQLLDSYRPHCPVNGLFLVIPADTLVTDSAEKLDGKARQIAQQFDRIQTALGIRFPVYVVITKCDKINGFRHFFEGMNQPEEQSQMIGWSNPAPLDEAFQPELVEQHLEGVRQRLVRRRLKLLEDPIHRGDPTLRRLDEVDSLYLFPDNLASLGTRLRRYLEAIFVAGEWSSMPLFLRGIYFTSALQKGGVVDKALSDALGVDVAAALGEDKESETPYFLRDLFMEKSFKEKGLVTRASNVDNLKRRRKLTLIGAAFVAVIALGAFTWLGQRQLESAVGDQARFWTAVQQTDADLRIVRGGKYQGSNELTKGLTLKAVHEEGPRGLTKPITIPAVYRPVAFVSGDPNLVRPDAYRALFQNTVFVPLIEATREKMKDVKATSWDDRATAALRQLFWLEGGQGVDPAQGALGAPLRPMFEFVLASPGDDAKKQLDAYHADQKVYDEAFGVVYKNGEVPRGAFGIGSPDSSEAIVKGVKTFLAYWDRQTQEAGKKAEQLRAVAVALAEFQAAEEKLLNVSGSALGTTAGAESYLTRWSEANRALGGARSRLDQALAADQLAKWDHESLLSKEYETAVQQVQATRRVAIVELLGAIPSSGQEKNDALLVARRDLTKARDEADEVVRLAAKDETRTQLVKYEGGLLARGTGLENKLQHRYEIHCDVLQRGAEPQQQPSGNTFAARVASAGQTGENARATISSLAAKPEFARDPQVKLVCDQAMNVARLGETFTRTVLVRGELRRQTRDAASWAGEVEARAAEATPKAIPFTKFDGAHDRKYDPDGAKGTAAELQFLASQAGAPSQGKDARVLDAADLQDQLANVQKGWREYVRDYQKQWQSDILTRLTVRKDSWAALHRDFNAKKVVEVNDALRDLATRRVEAFKAIGDDKAADAAARALDVFEKTKFSSTTRARMAQWAQMPAPLNEAREKLLSLTWEKLAGEYLMEPDVGAPSFVEVYWQNLCQAGLIAISGEVERQANEAVRDLRKLRRFPLAPFDAAADKRELSREQVDQAANLIRAVRARGDKPADSIARTAPPNWVGDLAGPIAALKRGTSEVTADEQAWIDQVQRFLEARADGGLTWTVQMQTPEKDPDKLRNGIFYLRLNADRDGTWVYVLTATPENLLAGGPVFPAKAFDVIVQGTDNGNKANPFPLLGDARQGDWAVAKFMGLLQERKKTGPGQWSAQVPLPKAATKDLSIPVKITFSKDIEWPSLAPPPAN
jgi:hypothetical protein